jgi:hypothetical protein
MASRLSVPTEDTYVTSRARLMKSRWEKRLGRALEVQTQRLMPDRDGARYRADLVLQDPKDGLPLVLFEVKTPGKTGEQAECNLRRLLDSTRLMERLGRTPPEVVLLIANGEKAEGDRIRKALRPGNVRVEVV